MCLRQALAEQQIQAFYQPKFNLRTGQVLGVEVLARWLHPTEGLLSPAAFLPDLEREGLLDELLQVLMSQALALQGQAHRQGTALNLAFNLQAVQVANAGLVAQIRRALVEHRVLGASLTFELTESGQLEVPSVALENLRYLRLMGCRVSLDDFGAGFSSLQRLCQLPFTEIKLDAEFVRGLAQGPRCRAVISSTLALGESLGLSVVVEGIETFEQYQQLLALGCTQGQGYWHARPMDGAHLLRWLQRSPHTHRRSLP